MMLNLGSWVNNPRWQRIVQKIQAMGPEQRAILNTASVDAAFGSDQMRRALQGLTMAADRKANRRNLSLAKERIDTRRSLRDKTMDFEKDQSDQAERIGLANIPVAGFFGYKQMQRDTEEAKKNRNLYNRIMGMN